MNLVHLDESYFIELKNALKREVALYVPLEGSMHTFALGADGFGKPVGKVSTPRT